MTRLVHISDLHFGRERPELLEPLRLAIRAITPDLVIVSGDLTQRARHSQFRAARAFLDGLECPWLSVPGNHDMPLDAFWHRILRPFGRYRRYVSRELAPVWSQDGVTLQAFNTADPWAWQAGKVRRLQLWRACQAFQGSEGLNIVVGHHPFEEPRYSDKTPMKRAAPALKALNEAGANLVLSGHLHKWCAAGFVTPEVGDRMLQVHVGTGLSNRLRGEENDFAVLDYSDNRLGITRMVAGLSGFEPQAPLRFQYDAGRWTRL
ncbi:metallophosphoesterase family protein [Tropicibacter naphthalenivorans]|uniref:Calcineurin-like phosphoesterase n=1 Tax=Tropicibacter naphthalenivorans TaxID=441103 RepID=A0A0P1GK25_9RHOB|nr:metallophosphoesterase [Tropicibacter naphthalenivorans]CUH82509.1 Calcineurin-like phosphoesterase [Tropicibacter naphthalenivorans]SMD06883.1 3',5'-cyclic AMP phosphodiesterase CpdA [Tropicibacter naphthalenivorans]